MKESLREYLGEFIMEPGASDSALSAIRSALDGKLPDDYLDFLAECNGGEGFVGHGYLVLWKAEELLEYNEAYEVADQAPGLFLFASNGSGEGFGFDFRNEPYIVRQAPFIGMDWDSALRVADSFEHFLERLFYTDGSLF